MKEDIPGFADVGIDFGKTTLDFLIRVTNVGEGVQLHLDFAEFQAVAKNQRVS